MKRSGFIQRDYFFRFIPTGILAVSLEKECPRDWRRFKNSCYRVFDQRATFDSALRRCAGHQGYLLSVKNGWENSFIARIISKYLDNQFWIGIYFNSTSGYWLDDGTEITWSKWTGPKTACPLMTGTRRWTQEKCTYYHQYICESDLYEEKVTIETTTIRQSRIPTSAQTSTITVSHPTFVTTSTGEVSSLKSTDTTPDVIVINRKKNPGRTHTDNRPSAIGIGSIGIGVLICVFLGVFLLDASKLWRDFAMFRHNMADIFKRFRRSKIRKNNQFKIEDIQEHST